MLAVEYARPYAAAVSTSPARQRRVLAAEPLVERVSGGGTQEDLLLRESCVTPWIQAHGTQSRSGVIPLSDFGLSAPATIANTLSDIRVFTFPSRPGLPSASELWLRPSRGAELGQVISEIRRLARWSDSDIAALVNVSRETVNRWGSGEYAKAISRINLNRLCILRDLLLALDEKPVENRIWLHTPTPTGESPFELLRSQRAHDVQRMIARIPTDPEHARRHRTEVPAPLRDEAPRIVLDEDDDD